MLKASGWANEITKHTMPGQIRSFETDACRSCFSFLFLISDTGAPHVGQKHATLDTGFPQSGQAIKLMQSNFLIYWNVRLM